VGAWERLPVGREDVRVRGSRRPPGGVTVGAWERVPVGPVDVHDRGDGRPTGGAEVGASERVPVGREHVETCPKQLPPVLDRARVPGFSVTRDASRRM